MNNFAISSIKYNDENFSFYKMTPENYKWLCEKYPEFCDPKPENFGDVILYSINKDAGAQNVKIGKVKSLEKPNGTIKIFFKDILKGTVTCEQVRKSLYHVKINKGWINKKDTTKNSVFAHPVSVADYNRILYPTSNTLKYADKMTLLEQHRTNNRWKDIVELFTPLSEFEKNFPEIWENDEYLDKIVYALSEVVKPSDRFKIRKNFLPHFIRFSDKLLSLAPANVSYLSVRAYHYYNEYLNTKGTKNKDDFESAIKYHEMILEINDEHIQSHYRIGRLIYAFLIHTNFNKALDRTPFFKDCFSHFEAAITAFEASEGEKQKKEYLRSIYSLTRLRLEFFLDYESAFFNNKLFGIDNATIFSENKYNLLYSVEQDLEKLRKNISKEESDDIDIDDFDKINPINLFYRLGMVYQYYGYIYLLKKNVDEKKTKSYFLKSNSYFDEALKTAFDEKTKAENKRRKYKFPFYIFTCKAINDFFLGEKEKAYQSLTKGQDSEFYRAATLAVIDNDYIKAREFIKRINNSSKMFNKAQKLKEKIGV